MTAYLVTACGAVFLSVVVSFIIPQGKLSKTITFVMRIVCIGILISPLVKIFTVPDTGEGEGADYYFICEQYSLNQSAALEDCIAEKFGAQSECTVNIVYGEEGFYAESVEVCLIGSYDNLTQKIYEYLEEADYINITVYETGERVA